MRYLILTSIVLLGGCTTAIDNTFENIVTAEDHEFYMFATYWVAREELEPELFNKDKQEIAENDLLACKNSLYEKGLLKEIKRKEIATIALVECMFEKGWRPTLMELIVTG